MSVADSLNKIKQLKAYQEQISLILLICLSASLGYGLGRLSEAKQVAAPLEITGVPTVQDSSANNSQKIETKTKIQAPEIAKASTEEASEKKYVASKSGTKYYLPSCSGANRIKEENKVWFASVEEAKARGLEPASGCKGL
ncbi:MAG: hypothetical protein AAB364_01420 [Patescibacteria group bacterium]